MIQSYPYYKGTQVPKETKLTETEKHAYEIAQRLFYKSLSELTNYQFDLIHDVDQIRANPGIPFLHGTRKYGTTIAILYPYNHASFPRRGQQVPYLFGKADRYTMLDGIATQITYYLSPQSDTIIQWRYYDGETLKEITPSTAQSLITAYVESIKDKWTAETAIELS